MESLHAFFVAHWDHEPEIRKLFGIKPSVFRFMESQDGCCYIRTLTKHIQAARTYCTLPSWFILSSRAGAAIAVVVTLPPGQRTQSWLGCSGVPTTVTA